MKLLSPIVTYSRRHVRIEADLCFPEESLKSSQGNDYMTRRTGHPPCPGMGSTDREGGRFEAEGVRAQKTELLTCIQQRLPPAWKGTHSSEIWARTRMLSIDLLALPPLCTTGDTPNRVGRLERRYPPAMCRQQGIGGNSLDHRSESLNCRLSSTPACCSCVTFCKAI